MGDNTRRGRVAFQETHGETHQPGLGEEERGQYGAPDTAEPTNAHTREPSHAEGRRNLFPADVLLILALLRRRWLV